MIAQLQSSALAGVEILINRALQHDPATRQRLSEMGITCLRIDITAPNLGFTVVSGGEQINLYSELEGEADVVVKGSANDLIAMALAEGDTITGRGVEVRGQLDRLQKLKAILSDLDIDWEGALAQIIGELPAHLAIKTAKATHRWQQQARPRVVAVAENFLKDEAQLTPNSEEMSQFASGVRTLSSDLERLNARVRRIQQQLAERQGESE
ncbi:SCP2 sterol-binding domain-containing protein [Porticoccus sp. W117]|uniref:ubiquinone biosynthesis accessory factor UbiJ n=1 Tax=Porticoccus sp. W117 TaxID=3054777 RepID=UPI002597EAEB|nr:SCP2 sterol-binding domain-containing protein [Porticoccus sp. W117]MDM3871589.1 SCP2 sterol-binding domain-containing protein [Porticoccus sp. W117]